MGVKGRRGIRCKQLLGNVKEARINKRKHYIAFCGELALDEVLSLS